MFEANEHPYLSRTWSSPDHSVKLSHVQETAEGRDNSGIDSDPKYSPENTSQVMVLDQRRLSSKERVLSVAFSRLSNCCERCAVRGTWWRPGGFSEGPSHLRKLGPTVLNSSRHLALPVGLSVGK